MTKKKRKVKKTLTAGSNYDVGFGKPPKSGQFKKGLSGNPNGRPRGAKNKRPASHEEPLKEILLKESYRYIEVHDGNGGITMPMAQAIMRSMTVKAAKGDHRSQRLFAEMLSKVEREDKAMHNEWLEMLINFKADGERELERRRELGIEGPDLLPHPDHIHIDFENNTAEIIGPFTKEEKAHYDMLIEFKSDCEKRLEKQKGELEEAKSKPERAEIKNRIKSFRSLLRKVEKQLQPV